MKAVAFGAGGQESEKGQVRKVNFIIALVLLFNFLNVNAYE